MPKSKTKSNSVAKDTKSNIKDSTLVRSIPRPPRATKPPTKVVDPQLVSHVCGLTDPWCSHARGAKYMDESSARTLPFTFNYSQTLSTNAAGSLAFLFVPRVAGDGSGQICTGVVTATDVSTLGPNFDACPVATLSGAQKYRVVSAGLRIKRISPDLTTSGMLYVRSYAYPEFANLGVFDIDGFNASQVVNIPLVNVTDSTFVCEHSSQLPQTFYNPTSNPANSFTGAGFNNITVGIIGAPASTPVIFVEYIMHVEYVFDDSAPLALAATPSPKFSPVIHSISKTITSESTNFFHESTKILGEFIKKKAINYLSTALLGAPNPAAKLAGGALAIMVD